MSEADIVKGMAASIHKAMERKFLTYLSMQFRGIFSRYPTLKHVRWEQDTFNGAPHSFDYLLESLEINEYVTWKTVLTQQDKQLIEAAQEIAAILFEVCTQEILDIFGNRLAIQADTKSVSMYRNEH